MRGGVVAVRASRVIASAVIASAVIASAVIACLAVGTGLAAGTGTVS